MNIEDRIKTVFQKVLDVKPQEINPNVNLEESLNIDSTEMVEISVAIKKEFNIPLKDNELKKTHSFNDIVTIVGTKKSPSSCGPSCGCGH